MLIFVFIKGYTNTHNCRDKHSTGVILANIANLIKLISYLQVQFVSFYTGQYLNMHNYLVQSERTDN